jgi:2',3'-cyclic-nucleotide 2'-phosphodiesterase (5'-nucleotidase family)
MFTRKKIGIFLSSVFVFTALVFTSCDTNPRSDVGGGGGDPYKNLKWSNVASWDGADTTVLGVAAENISGTDIRYKETAAGNLIADGIAAYARYTSGANVDFAMLNGQNVKGLDPSGIPKGNITLNSLSQSGGLGDTLFIVTYTGAEIETLINIFVNSNAPEKWSSNCVVLVSKEVSYTVTPDSDPSKPPHATAIKVNGSSIVQAKDYRVAVGNFMAGKNETGTADATGGGANFVPYGKNKTPYSSDSLKQAVAKYILAKSSISPIVGGRITGSVPVIQPAG